MFLQALKFLKFSSLPKALWFQEKVKNETIITSRNGLHKLPIAISGKTPKPKPLSVFELRHQKWTGFGPQNKNFWTHLATWKGIGNLFLALFASYKKFYKNEVKFSEDLW